MCNLTWRYRSQINATISPPSPAIRVTASFAIIGDPRGAFPFDCLVKQQRRQEVVSNPLYLPACHFRTIFFCQKNFKSQKVSTKTSKNVTLNKTFELEEMYRFNKCGNSDVPNRLSNFPRPLFDYTSSISNDFKTNCVPGPSNSFNTQFWLYLNFGKLLQQRGSR